MKTIQMGLNTEPSWVKADEVIERWKASGNEAMIQSWERMRADSLELRAKIIEAVEADGVCELNWSCTGATLFDILAWNWKQAMPEYRFEIARYSCIVHKN